MPLLSHGLAFARHVGGRATPSEGAPTSGHIFELHKLVEIFCLQTLGILASGYHQHATKVTTVRHSAGAGHLLIASGHSVQQLRG